MSPATRNKIIEYKVDRLFQRENIYELSRVLWAMEEDLYGVEERARRSGRQRGSRYAEGVSSRTERVKRWLGR
jgi:hypothetical protein